ncbi:YkyA family protein [Shimazuella kribbensis]|uniref:YkyA family protein n=1 Tax=Shimazuella kribbensis TaxID=139808 RepID=UPI0004154290|nr:YkyA family protein [Shimazuella kribbensis]
MNKRIGIAVFVLCFMVLVGCTEVQNMYTASSLSDQIQKELDKAESQMKNQIEIDKILSVDPNITDQKKIAQAITDFQRLDTKLIPPFENTIKQVKANLKTLEKYMEKIPSKEIKQLGNETIQSFGKMLDAKLAYIAEVKKSSELQKSYFQKLQKGEIPTDAEFDQLNQDITVYNDVFQKMNNSIDAFNSQWEKLVQKAGQELEKP